jgi:hypothetical protein
MQVAPGVLVLLAFVAGVSAGLVLGIILSPRVMDRYVNRGRVTRPRGTAADERVWVTGEPDDDREEDLYDPNVGLPRY